MIEILDKKLIHVGSSGQCQKARPVIVTAAVAVGIDYAWLDWDESGTVIGVGEASSSAKRAKFQSPPRKQMRGMEWGSSQKAASSCASYLVGSHGFYSVELPENDNQGRNDPSAVARQGATRKGRTDYERNAD